MNKLWHWTLRNKEWLFSGIGVVLISTLLAFGMSGRKEEPSPGNQANKNAHAVGGSAIVQIDKSSGNITINEPRSSIESSSVKFSVSDFQRIRVLGVEGGWEDLSMRIQDIKKCYKPDGRADLDAPDCLIARFLMGEFVAKSDFLAFGLAQINPVFDIVFVNNSSSDLTIDRIGVEVLDTRRKIWSAGTPEPLKVPVTDQYSIRIPGSICRTRPELESREDKCTLPYLISIDLKDPYFLTPNSVFRYGINIIEEDSTLGNATLVRFFLHTNKGKAYSGIVYIVQ
ncbi:hypothetical protein H0901_12875 [Microcystis aeruginosa BLCCF158]|jgi:hypothetical protein|uniref:Uncharacterized protein n=1 Tax=Microcystis aeruginosa BLCC-F158 TaxID=2755316 RepID=A0A841UYB0_MICAE|nr:hypothetical protein [Microcystis aeruginosa]MBC1196131.1 hypothetical protein [Microcystis aeruginosa BLCC-F158]